MKAAPRLAVLAVMLPLLGGCTGFSEPLADEAGVQVDASPFIGAWHVQAEPETAIVLEPAGTDPNILRGVSTSTGTGDGVPPVPFTVALSVAGGQTIASVLADDPEVGSGGMGWVVVAVDLTADDTRMTVRGLDAQAIADAVASGDLKIRPPKEPAEGTIHPFAYEADGTALRDYLIAHPEAFDAARETILVRGTAVAATVGPDHAFLPTAISGSVGPATAYDDRAVPTERVAPDGSDAGGYGYPGGSGSYPWPELPADPNRPPGMRQPEAQRPFGSAASTAPDTDTPAPLKGLVAGLALLIVVGVASALGVNAVKRRHAAARETSHASAIDNAARSPSDDDARSRTRTLARIRRYAWPAVLVLAVALGPIVYLTVLLRGLAFPDSMLGAEPGAQGLLNGLAPYVLVFSIGTLIAVAEVATTFPAFAVEALGTKWAALLVLLNGFGTTVVYAVVMAYTSRFDHPLLRALAIAAGFAVLIRTRFVLARDLRASDADDGAGPRPADGVSLDLGWPYGRVQRLCRQRIDRDLLRDPRYATARVLARFPDASSLRRVAVDRINGHVAAVAEGLQARLDALYAQDIDPGIVRARVARFVVETGGVSDTLFLIEHASPIEGAGPEGAE